MQFTLSALATLSLAAGSMAHMMMTEPPQWISGPFDNAPLLPDGSDFPCQGNLGMNRDKVTTYTAGSTGKLKVVGGATHGGGSGQMVITYDKEPTSSSVWRVLQSWEGDHPVQADGNTSGDRLQEHPVITFAIPEELPAGDAVIAWNWFNRVGNREWYMKCSSVKIDSKTVSTEGYLTLPEMFRANVPQYSGSCTIPDSVSAIDFGKHAGKNVVVGSGSKPELIPGCEQGDSSPSQPETPTQPDTPAPSSTYVEQPAGPTSVPEEGDDNSESGSGDSEELPTQPDEPIASPTAAPAAPTAAPSQPDNSNKGTDSGSCVEGATVCSEGNTWSQCGSGRLQNMGLVPAGLTCSDGKLVVKRSLRFSAEHRRHRSRHV